MKYGGEQKRSINIQQAVDLHPVLQPCQPEALAGCTSILEPENLDKVNGEIGLQGHEPLARRARRSSQNPNNGIFEEPWKKSQRLRAKVKQGGRVAFDAEFIGEGLNM